MLSGVWITQVKIIILKVIHRAWGSPGSVRTARQLVSPDGTIAPIPSQVVKDRSRTPSSGRTPKTANRISAGSAIHVTAPVFGPPAVVVVAWLWTTGGAMVVMIRWPGSY